MNWLLANTSYFQRISSQIVDSLGEGLRKNIESIAAACVVANESWLPGLARSLESEYRPKRIMVELGKMNPNCFPVPVIQTNTDKEKRALITRPTDDWLTKDEAVREYGKLSEEMVHAKLKTYKTLRTGDFEKRLAHCLSLANRMNNLLSSHRIHVLDQHITYFALMSTIEDRQVQVAQFIKVPESLRQDALAGNLDPQELEALISQTK